MPKCCRTNVSNTFLKAWISNGSQDIKKHFWPMLWEVYPAIQEKPCKHPTKILWKNEDWMIVFSTQASKNFQRHWQSWASLQDWYKRLQASLRPLALMGWTVAPCPLFLILRARAKLPFFCNSSVKLIRKTQLSKGLLKTKSRLVVWSHCQVGWRQAISQPSKTYVRTLSSSGDRKQWSR